MKNTKGLLIYDNGGLKVSGCTTVSDRNKFYDAFGRFLYEMQTYGIFQQKNAHIEFCIDYGEKKYIEKRKRTFWSLIGTDIEK